MHNDTRQGAIGPARGPTRERAPVAHQDIPLPEKRFNR